MSKPETSLRLSVGDRAIVTRKLKGHGFEIGMKVIIRTLYPWADPPHYYATEFSNPSNAWWVNDQEVERVKKRKPKGRP